MAAAATLAAALLAGCGLTGPVPECDQGNHDGSVTISCQDAVSVARDQLPTGHPDVTRIQFLYGSYRPLLPQLGGAVPAYVVFTFSDTTRLAVQLWLSQGELAAESPEAY